MYWNLDIGLVSVLQTSSRAHTNYILIKDLTVIRQSLQQSLLFVLASVFDNVTYTLINILETFVSFFVISASMNLYWNDKFA